MHRRHLHFDVTRQRFFHPDGEGGGAGGGAGAGVAEKIELTKEEFDRRLHEEFGKGKRLGAEGATVTKAERERLAELEKKETEREKENRAREEKLALERGEFDKARGRVIESAQEEERKKHLPEIEKRDQRLKRLEDRIRGSVRDKILAVAGARAYDPGQVADLLEGRRVRLSDDLDVEVIDESGQPALVGGKPMTLAQLVEGYLDAHPNLVKSNGGGSGGAGGGKSLKEGETGELAKLEEAVKTAKDLYLTTKQNHHLTAHREAVKALNDYKAKAGK